MWRGIPGYLDKLGLPGKTLGIVGFGYTGIEMAALGKAFGMKVMVYTRSAVEAPANVDVFSVRRARGRHRSPDRGVGRHHAGHAADRRDLPHVLARPQFARMKPTAFIINMARGPVIDEAALLNALRPG